MRVIGNGEVVIFQIKVRFSAEISFLLLVALVVVSLFGCSSTEPLETSSASTPTITETEAPVVTPTLESTPTTDTAQVVLLAPAGSDPNLVVALEGIITELAQGDGLRFEVINDLTDVDWDSGVQIMIVIPSEQDYPELAANHPQVQFLAINVPGLEPLANLSIIVGDGERPDQQGFTAGYIAAVITPDWRVGVINRSDMPFGKAAQGGFINGAIFYCGLCRPAYPPFFQYPVLATLAGGESPEEQQATADLLISNAVQTVYVSRDAGDESLLEYLADNGLNIIGSTPPPDHLLANWIATIQYDWVVSVKEAWPKLVSGEGGFELHGRTQVAFPNEDLFSTGRQNFVNRMLVDLLAGFIETGVDPLTGEPR